MKSELEMTPPDSPKATKEEQKEPDVAPAPAAEDDLLGDLFPKAPPRDRSSIFYDRGAVPSGRGRRGGRPRAARPETPVSFALLWWLLASRGASFLVRLSPCGLPRYRGLGFNY